MTILDAPVVIVLPARYPIAVLNCHETLVNNDCDQIAVFELPLVFLFIA